MLLKTFLSAIHSRTMSRLGNGRSHFARPAPSSVRLRASNAAVGFFHVRLPQRLPHKGSIFNLAVTSWDTAVVPFFFSVP